MNIYITFSLFDAPINLINSILPKESHLKELSEIPPLFRFANSRVIIPDYSNSYVLKGYVIKDVKAVNDNSPEPFLKEDSRYIPIEDLDDKSSDDEVLEYL